MKLGIFGGTFDPIHFGHLVLAEQCREWLRLDQVWFVPAGQPPHKLMQERTAGGRRLEMVELAIAGHPDFGVCTWELDRPGPSFTVDTLEHLAAEDTARELFLLVGSDSLRDLPTWRHPRRILEMARLVVARRVGSPISFDDVTGLVDAETLRRIKEDVVDISPVGVSSTECRRRVRQGLSIRYLVPRAVECYIQTHHLYGEADGESGCAVVHPVE